MYALVDVNSFFASCEQLFRPDLRNKPIVVLSNNDGCIVARSKEAKCLGIPDLVPYFQQKEFLKKHHVHVFSSNYELYGDISRRIMTTLERFAPEMEIYSIDEAFLSLKGLPLNYASYGRKIRGSVLKNTGMPVGVGIGPTKTLAKLASHIAKKSAKCNYVCAIEDPRQWHQVFKKIPVNKVWGIGSKLAKRLSMLQIFSVYQLMQQDAKHMRKQFSVNVARTIDELNGIECYQLEQAPEPKKQIYSTRSFGRKIRDCYELEQSVAQYASRACQKLRQQHHLVKTMLVFASSAHFIEHSYSRSVAIALPMPTNDTRLVIEAARAGIRKVIYKPGVSFARAGVGLIELKPESPEQLDAFTESQSLKSKQLMHIVDQINRTQCPIFFASQGIEQHWKMTRNFMSPRYTTKWEDLPLVNT